MSKTDGAEIPSTLDRGRYRVERVIGEGGTSTVLLATDTRLGVQRAIKLMNPRWARSERNRTRFRTEAFAQAGLQHTNVLMVHDAIEDEQGAYLVMELAEADSLATRVLRHGTLSVDEVIEVGVTIGGALIVAHDAGLIHRDIKPQNILMDKHGVLKLADFGIAHLDNRGEALTQAEEVMGTWDYMPPEQREASVQVDGRSDVYAFGATLYALLTGRKAAALHNPEGWAAAYAGVPPGLAVVLQRATRLYPEDRYADMRLMVAELAKLRDAPAPPPEPEPAPPPAAAPGGPMGVVIAALVGLGLVAAAAAGLFFALRDPPAPTAPAPAPVAAEAPQTAPAPAPAEQPADPAEEPAEQLTPDAAPAPAPAARPRRRDSAPAPSPAPSPAPGPAPTGRRVITVQPAAAAPAPSAAPSPAPAATAEPTGVVRVRTVPSGAVVTVRGRRPAAAPGGGYSLPVGQHTLELRSQSGEETRVAVSVRSGQTVDICYSFDSNSACGGGR